MNASEGEEAQTNVLIVMGDGRYGSLLERFLCAKHSRDFNQIVGLVDVQFEGNREIDASSRDQDKELPDSCKVEYIDFSAINSLDGSDVSRIIQKYEINWLCLIPFGDTFCHPEKVQTVLEIYKKNRGQNVLMISSIGVDSEKIPVGDLRLCEEAVRIQFPTLNCILRMQICLEDLDFFAEDVRNDKTWRFSIGPGQFAPVSFKEDIVFAAASIMKSNTIEDRFRDKVFTLTGPVLINGIDLAAMTSTAFNVGDVKFANASGSETRKVIDREVERQRRQGRKQEGVAHKDTHRSVALRKREVKETVDDEDGIWHDKEIHSASADFSKPPSRGNDARRRPNFIAFVTKHLGLGSKKTGVESTFTASKGGNNDTGNDRIDDITGAQSSMAVGFTPETFPVADTVGGVDVRFTAQNEREMILNRFELVAEGELELLTDHVVFITKREPITVTAYLRQNELLFKGHK